MLIQTTYESVRHLIKVGDQIVFGGEGFVSDFIKFWTRSQLSHCATVLEVCEPDRRVKLIESTTLNGKDGVQINYASERIATYEGRVWWLPLSVESRRKLDVPAFREFLLAQVGKPYDRVLIAHLLFDKLNLIPAPEDWSAFVCSEIGSAGYKVGRLLPANIDTSEVVPQRMAEYQLYADNHFQLKGKGKAIRDYNSRRIQ